MGGACSAYGARGEVYTGFWWGNLRVRDNLEDTGVDGRIILRRIFRKWNWIDLALVNAVMNLRVP